ncbi:Predicted arabinose efflux permease, MFS family [Roseateles sp. YR242]|uniref:MFS transporter n=1 Tax=Roseateles sp. YR242 TaxID=1855305 RepID=UPI0008C46F0C|nr:MFS transporter [Roseateles sp. YR242]SEK66182.1 Predicted arabinose efflux permease, MFS family [Roseateles sp. YR242]
MFLRLQTPKWFPGLSTTARWLLLCELFSLCASSVGHSTALWWLAGHQGAHGLTAYSAIVALTALISLPALSPLGDRRAKRLLLVRGQATLVAVAAALCALASVDLLSLWSICVCGVVTTVAQAVVQPVQSAALLDVVPADRLSQAIRIRRGTQAIGSLCGPALAGLAMSFGGVGWAYALQLLLAAACTVAATKLPARVAAQAAARQGRWVDDLRAGLRAKWLVRVDRWWTLSGALMMVFYAPAIGLMLPLRLQSMGAPATWFGWCSGALSVGVLIGVLGVADRLMLRAGRHRAMLMAVALCGVCLGAVGAVDRVQVLALLFAVIGLCTSVTQLMGQTHRALAVPEDFRARMASAQLAVAHMAAAGAPLLAGLLLQRWPVAQVYGVMSAGFLLSGLALLAVPGLKAFLRLAPEDARNWYERQFPAAFLRADLNRPEPVPPDSAAVSSAARH